MIAIKHVRTLIDEKQYYELNNFLKHLGLYPLTSVEIIKITHAITPVQHYLHVYPTFMTSVYEELESRDIMNWHSLN